MQDCPELSIIVPTLNERENLRHLLGDLALQSGLVWELIISDGGSSDGTLEFLQKNATEVISAPKGRGSQMNKAARLARGSYLLFLHADSRLQSPTLLAKALENLKWRMDGRIDGRVAGHFSLQFIGGEEQNPRAYQYLAAKTALNRPHTTNGDQGFLLSRKFFNELGGFSEELPFLEDQILAAQIREQGEWITLPGVLQTSSRRFASEGFYRRYILMALMMGLFEANVMSFFSRAPTVYREQKTARRLKLTPFFQVIWAIHLEELGWKGSWKAWLRVGRFVRQNIWQIFFWLDFIGPWKSDAKKGSWLNFYDRYVNRILDNGLCDKVVMVVTFGWVVLILVPVFSVLDCLQNWRERSLAIAQLP